MANLRPTTAVIKGRMHYAHIFEPVPPFTDPESKQLRYEMTLLIDKNDQESMTALKTAINNAINNAIDTKKISSQQTKKLALPVHDGDEDKAENQQEFTNVNYLNLKSNARTDGNGGFQPMKVVVEDGNGQHRAGTPEELYNGCYVYVFVNCFVYSVAGNVGVSVSFNAVKKWKDGQQLGYVLNVDDVFANFSQESNKTVATDTPKRDNTFQDDEFFNFEKRREEMQERKPASTSDNYSDAFIMSIDDLPF